MTKIAYVEFSQTRTLQLIVEGESLQEIEQAAADACALGMTDFELDADDDKWRWHVREPLASKPTPQPDHGVVDGEIVHIYDYREAMKENEDEEEDEDEE